MLYDSGRPSIFRCWIPNYWKDFNIRFWLRVQCHIYHDAIFMNKIILLDLASVELQKKIIEFVTIPSKHWKRKENIFLVPV